MHGSSLAPSSALAESSRARRQARRDGRPLKLTLLGGVLPLLDVDSVESLARKVLDDRLRSSGAYLNPAEYDDALSYVIAEAWVLSKRYDVAKGTQSFSTYAYRILWRRVPSWYRQRFGDTRYRVNPTWVTLDDNDLDEIAAEWEWEEPDLPTTRYTQTRIQQTYPHLSPEDAAALTLKANVNYDARRKLDPETTALYERINVLTLTPEGRRTFDRIARPMVEQDLSLEQIAARFDMSRRWVAEQLRRLRAEIAPMLEDDDDDADRPS